MSDLILSPVYAPDRYSGCLWKGIVTMVHTGQVIMSIHTKLLNKKHVTEALYKANVKFPGGQVTHISKKWGFTKFNTDEFEDIAAEKQFILDGCGVKDMPNCAPLGQMVSPALLRASASPPPYSHLPINPTSYPRKKMGNK